MRCRSVLYRGTSADLNRVVALTLGAALVFLIAQFFPIVELDVNGLTSSATLLGAIRVLWHEQMQVVATMVFLFTMLFPAIELGSLLYVSLGLRLGVKVPGFNLVLRAVRTARAWGMTEVLMIGILITVDQDDQSGHRGAASGPVRLWRADHDAGHRRLVRSEGAVERGRRPGAPGLARHPLQEFRARRRAAALPQPAAWWRRLAVRRRHPHCVRCGPPCMGATRTASAAPGRC